VTSGSRADAPLLHNPAFLRLLGLSALGHLLVALALGLASWRPLPSAELDVIYIDALPAAALPSPAAAAPPAPPRQQVAEVVIPRRPQPKPKPPAAKPPPAPARPEPKPAAPQPPPEPPPKQSASASEVLEKLRNEAQQRAPRGVADGQGTGERAGILDVERAAYIRKVQAAIEPHWVASACVRQRSAPLWTVALSSGGVPSDITLGRSSGDRHCDDSAERAIHKAQPLPPPPPGIRALDINFEELR
jgi:TonB family protein